MLGQANAKVTHSALVTSLEGQANEYCALGHFMLSHRLMLPMWSCDGNSLPPSLPVPL